MLSEKFLEVNCFSFNFHKRNANFKPEIPGYFNYDSNLLWLLLHF